ncbi:hypothetical protein G3I40_05645 [Streptomyces sp. SID14478]|uniref:hypothetical protein n=1 Tax=Streptomyces sp. SID14478 TaxID=2706073 RepID=UPI0013D9CA22|nr:hypothetical protein [Streptomyces sp. SID14478]NEB74714.1 hypothetical protein [Streptomyces sp. SID14478]
MGGRVSGAGKRQRAARDSVNGADAVAAELHLPDLAAAAHAAFVHGTDLVLAGCGILALLAAVAAALFLPRGKSASDAALGGGRREGGPYGALRPPSAAAVPGVHFLIARRPG